MQPYIPTNKLALTIKKHIDSPLNKLPPIPLLPYSGMPFAIPLTIYPPPSPPRQVASSLALLSSLHAANLHPNQNPKPILFRLFHQFKAPSLNTSSDIPISYPSSTPSILLFRFTTLATVLYPFMSSTYISLPNYSLCNEPCSPKILLSWATGMPFFRSSRLLFLPTFFPIHYYSGPGFLHSSPPQVIMTGI